MSDSKRGTLITVGAPKGVVSNVSRTVRLSINLVESNESKYPELNYKELVKAEERKKKVENGKTTGLDPYSDNDEDVQRVARKFEQKYGGKSTYGRKGRSKHDDYADIGAGYDENDSFIDNTDGYDEIFPPECDTYLGGFYINSGSLEFKSVPTAPAQAGMDGDNRRNKRRISSSSSSEDSSESSSESESADEKDSGKVDQPDKRPLVNGTAEGEHRKKKKQKSEKKKAKRIRRTDSSAATSGKQTSDDNAHMEVESGDSRTSQSDSLASKPAPSSENAITSDSSRDISDKPLEFALPAGVALALEELATAVRQAGTTVTETQNDPCILKLERALQSCSADASMSRAAWARAARTLDTQRAKLMQRAKALHASTSGTELIQSTLTVATTIPSNSTTATKLATSSNAPEKSRKRDEDLDPIDIGKLTPEERNTKIEETIGRLKSLIEERKPSMIQNYKAECERVQEEKKKLMIASASDGVPRLEKRLPKRRFPWCQRTRSLLIRLTRLSADEASAALLLVRKVLPLFPEGFVRMPTLLRQASISREVFANVKPSEIKKHMMVPAPPPIQTPLQPSQHTFTEPIQFPSSLTVTTSVKGLTDITEKHIQQNLTSSVNPAAKNPSASKQESQFPNVYNSVITNSKDLLDKPGDKDKPHKEINSRTAEKTASIKVDDKYMPPNSIGSITITPVLTNHKTDSRQPTKVNNSVTIITESKQKEPLIRVKSPATLHKEANEIAAKKEKEKQRMKHDKPSQVKTDDKRSDSPLYVDTSQPKERRKDTPSPNLNKDEITQKQIETMRVAENNIPRPALVPVHHSPTFAKPDKRPPDTRKAKKDIVIISDLDPLSDVPQESYAVDDSSSDVELIEDVTTRARPEVKQNKVAEPKSDPKPSIVNREHPKSTVVKNFSDTKKDSVPSHKSGRSDGSNYKQHHKHSSKERVKVVMGDRGHRSNTEVRQLPSGEKIDVDESEADIDKVMRNIREMQDSQEPNFTSNSYGGVITSEQTSLSSMDGCSAAISQ